MHLHPSIARQYYCIKAPKKGTRKKQGGEEDDGEGEEENKANEDDRYIDEFIGGYRHSNTVQSIKRAVFRFVYTNLVPHLEFPASSRNNTLSSPCYDTADALLISHYASRALR